MTPPRVYITLFLKAELVELSLYFITKTQLRKLSSVSCHWSVAGDTAWQQTLHLGSKGKLHACSGGLLIVLDRYGITSLKLSQQLQGSKYNRKIYGDAQF